MFVVINEKYGDFHCEKDKPGTTGGEGTTHSYPSKNLSTHLLFNGVHVAQ